MIVSDTFSFVFHIKNACYISCEHCIYITEEGCVRRGVKFALEARIVLSFFLSARLIAD